MFSIMKNVGHNFVELKFIYEFFFFYLTISLYLLFSCPPEQIFWLHHWYKRYKNVCGYNITLKRIDGIIKEDKV